MASQWSATTVYAKGATVSYPVSNPNQYISLASYNLQHTPSSSPTWWTITASGPPVTQVTAGFGLQSSGNVTSPTIATNFTAGSGIYILPDITGANGAPVTIQANVQAVQAYATNPGITVHPPTDGDGGVYFIENAGVKSLIAGTGIAVSQATGDITISASGTAGVSQLVAGSNISISPTGGTGVVTINSTAANGVTSLTSANSYATVNQTTGAVVLTVPQGAGGVSSLSSYDSNTLTCSSSTGGVLLTAPRIAAQYPLASAASGTPGVSIAPHGMITTAGVSTIANPFATYSTPYSKCIFYYTLCGGGGGGGSGFTNTTNGCGGGGGGSGHYITSSCVLSTTDTIQVALGYGGAHDTNGSDSTLYINRSGTYIPQATAQGGSFGLLTDGTIGAGGGAGGYGGGGCYNVRSDGGGHNGGGGGVGDFGQASNGSSGYQNSYGFAASGRGGGAPDNGAGSANQNSNYSSGGGGGGIYGGQGAADPSIIGGNGGLGCGGGGGATDRFTTSYGGSGGDGYITYSFEAITT